MAKSAKTGPKTKPKAGRLYKFESYWQGLSPEEKDRIAAKVGISKISLGHIVYRHSRISAERALLVEKATKGYITAKYLRPDLF